jgi:hypothetical protein
MHTNDTSQTLLRAKKYDWIQISFPSNMKKEGIRGSKQQGMQQLTAACCILRQTT